MEPAYLLVLLTTIILMLIILAIYAIQLARHVLDHWTIIVYNVIQLSYINLNVYRHVLNVTMPIHKHYNVKLVIVLAKRVQDPVIANV